MAEQNSTPPEKPYLEVGTAALQRHLDAIPEGKKGALVVGFERGGLVPTINVGVAARVNGSWSLGADARLQKKAKPTTRFYTAWTW